MPPLPTILLILAAISAGATTIAVLVAIRSTREARSAIFPIVKEEETLRAQRARISILFWLAVTALLLGGWLAAVRLAPAPAPGTVAAVSATAPAVFAGTATPTATTAGNLPPAAPTQTAIPSQTPTPLPPSPPPTESPGPTFTPLPPTSTSTPSPLPPTATATPTATSTPTPQPTATFTPTPTPPPPTATPTSQADAARLPPPSTRTPAPPGVRIGPIRFAEDITPDFKPVNPGRVFSPAIQTIYAVYPFKGMDKGLDFSMVWFQNGVEIAREDTQWEYGDRGTSYSFLRLRGPGLYKLELYVNDTVVATSLFEIR